MRPLLVVVCLFAGLARADRGALSIDGAAGFAALTVPAPSTSPARSTLSTAASVWFGARYALSNHLEVSATGFFEPPVTLWHNGVTLQVPEGAFTGTLTHSFLRYGGQVGARFVTGMVWRFIAGLEAGLALRSYSGLAMLNDKDPANPVDYGLALADRTLPAFTVSPLVGLEWAGGDHWSVAVLPRAQLLFGAGGLSWAVVVPLQLSWSWYL